MLAVSRTMARMANIPPDFFLFASWRTNCSPRVRQWKICSPENNYPRLFAMSAKIMFATARQATCSPLSANFMFATARQAMCSPMSANFVFAGVRQSRGKIMFASFANVKKCSPNCSPKFCSPNNVRQIMFAKILFTKILSTNILFANILFAK